MGGCYMAIVNGFAGLRLTPEGLRIAPYLPEGLHGYCFKFRFHGSLLRLSVEKGRIRMELLEGAPVSFRYQDRICHLTETEIWEEKDK